MAIDRGPWNALVDDDGSGLVGSVWNKAAIKTVLLDPTDAALLAAGVVAPWTPVLQATGGAGATYAAQTGQRIQVGRLVHAICRVTLASKGTLTGALRITGVSLATIHVEAITISHVSGLVTPCIAIGGYLSGDELVLYKVTAAATAQATALTAEDVSAAFDVIVGTTFISA